MGVNSSSISRVRFRRAISRSRKGRRLLTSSVPALSANPRIDKALLLYRGEKSAKPHRKNQKNGESLPIYKEAEKGRNVSRKSDFLWPEKLFLTFSCCSSTRRKGTRLSISPSPRFWKVMLSDKASAFIERRRTTLQETSSCSGFAVCSMIWSSI